MSLIPGPALIQPGDSLAPVGSPYWLGINGAWVHLEGARPGVTRAVERPRSSLTTVDGVRYSQHAPRVAREWEVSWELEAPSAVAALAVAAELDEVWLHDEAAAAANMLSPRDCYGDGAVIVCTGVPLRALTPGHVVTANVRGGVPTVITAWSPADAGTDLLEVDYPGGTATVECIVDGPAVAAASALFVPASDGEITVTVIAPADTCAGMQLTEGVTEPAAWLAGERTPCRVEVVDANQTARMAWPGRQSLADYSVTLREVG